LLLPLNRALCQQLLEEIEGMMAAGQQRLIMGWGFGDTWGLAARLLGLLSAMLRCKATTHRWRLSIELLACGAEVAGPKPCKRELGRYWARG
jgi:hypothetical protein